MRYYVTYCDSNYIVRCVALIQSMQRHFNHDFRMYVVCLDEAAALVLDRLAFPQVKAISLSWVERYDEALLMAKTNRTHREYCWTLTPTVILRVSQLIPEGECLVYTDADTLYFADDSPVFSELGEGSVLIHSHRFAEVNRVEHERYGTYNVGLMVFRNNDEGRRVLRWWRARCIEWCHDYVDKGRYGDQAYLNDWPSRFSGVRVLEHKGAGTAPWNQIRYLFCEGSDGIIHVDEQELIHYHFHALSIIAPGVYQCCRNFYPYKSDVVETVYRHYAKAMDQAIGMVRRKVDAGFVSGIRDPIQSVDSQWPVLVADAKVPAFARLDFKYDARQVGDGWAAVYLEKQESEVNLATIEYFVGRIQRPNNGCQQQMLQEFQKIHHLFGNEMSAKFIQVLRPRVENQAWFPSAP